MAKLDRLKTMTDLDPKSLAKVLAKYAPAALPIFALSLIFVLLVPLHPAVMDVFLAANFALSAIVLLTVMYMSGPLEFSAFPSLLLAMTLLRLVLNTATTRLILTNAKAGPAAAGHVVQVFGEFVAGGSLMVGVVIFAIIIVIQFVVITKGATRIAEVAARFTLDGMPGKQMAIDADLAAETINEVEAKRRREEITRESDFYGAMDGASKFVRGDAVAGLIITFINILGGMYVGMVQEKFTFMHTLDVFTTLTIGDGLVSQIPAFIVSIAAALIVTRSASKKNLGSELFGQVTQQPVALGLAGIFMFVLAFTPLPKLPLLGLAASAITLAVVLGKSKRLAAVTAETAAARDKSKTSERPEQLILPDPMEVEVGYGLIRIVDRKQGGDLLDRITNMRKQLAQELGIVVPPVRIRDNIQLQANQYRIRIKGNMVAEGEVMPGHCLAIDSGMVSERVHGIDTAEPAFGLPAVWITPDNRSVAEQRNYTVVEASSVLSTHLTETIKRHADELLSRHEVNRLIDMVKERSPKLIEELIPQVLKAGEIQKVLQLLMRERVSIRDLETIIETLGDYCPRTKDPEVLVEYVRAALARGICEAHRGKNGAIACVTLDPALEETIAAHLETTERGTFWAMPPELQGKVVAAIRAEVERVLPTMEGQTAAILCAPRIRPWVRRMVESALPHVPVLSFVEIVRGVEIQTRGMVTLTNES